MAAKAVSAFSGFSALSSPSFQRRRTLQVALWRRSSGREQNNLQHLAISEVKPCQFRDGLWKVKEKSRMRNYFLSATSSDDFQSEELETDALEPEECNLNAERISPTTILLAHPGENGGRPGFVSFYTAQPKQKGLTSSSSVEKKHNSLLWFVGPTVLVLSFIFPSLYLRRILSSIFEDSLLTDFLILFFTEALFYCGVAAFLCLMDYLWRATQSISTANINGKLSLRLSYRISSVAILVLSLIIPMVTMGFVWPWTGPAASATLAPYLVGIVVQFTFEQYARYVMSPSWPVIPIIFQIYRLHQLNRAAQLVTALSFTVRGAEMTPHNLAINKSLGTLLSVLQLLGVLCIWSLSSFLVRFFPSSSITGQ